MGLFTVLFNKDKNEVSKETTVTEKAPENRIFSHFIDDLSYYSEEFNTVMQEKFGKEDRVGYIVDFNLRSTSFNMNLDEYDVPSCMNENGELVLVSSVYHDYKRDRDVLLVDTEITKYDRRSVDLDVIRYRVGKDFYTVENMSNRQRMSKDSFSTLLKCCDLMLFKYSQRDLGYKEIVSILLMSLTRPIENKFTCRFPEVRDKNGNYQADRYILRHYINTPENEKKVRETTLLAFKLVEARRGSMYFSQQPIFLIQTYIQLEACIRILKNIDYYPETKEVLSELENIKALNQDNIESVMKIAIKAHSDWRKWSEEDRKRINSKLTEVYNSSCEEICDFLKKLDGLLDNIKTSVERINLQDTELDDLLDQLS